MLRRLLISAVVAALLTVSAPGLAAASTSVAGTGEPAFTNTTTNTYYFGYNRFNSYGTFRLGVNYYVGASNVFSEFTQYIGASGVASTGTLFANFTGVVNTLQSGTTYGVCVNGKYSFAGDGTEFPEANSSCSSSTIDRSTPTVSGVSVEGTATYSNKAAGQSLALAGLYSDSMSPPWPATYVCVKKNLDPATACNGATFDFTQVCSNRVGTGTQNNPFSCVYNIDAADPDGPLTFCARASDSSLPDRPGSADQFATLTSSSANISGPSCGYVILDRAAPSLAISGGAATATTGQLLSFSAVGDRPGRRHRARRPASRARTPGAGATTPRTGRVSTRRTRSHSPARSR